MTGTFKTSHTDRQSTLYCIFVQYNSFNLKGNVHGTATAKATALSVLHLYLLLEKADPLSTWGSS